MFIGDISDGKLFFSKLKAYEAEHPNSKVDHLPLFNGLKENFYMRFEDFRLDKVVLAGLVGPFCIKNCFEYARKAQSVFNWVDIATVASEMIDLQEDIGKTDRQISDPLEFWKKATSVQATQKLDTTILCMFGNTYMCESGFSNMNFIKKKYRSNLTNAHLHQLMRISLTELIPNFEKVAKSSICHLSH